MGYHGISKVYGNPIEENKAHFLRLASFILDDIMYPFICLLSIYVSLFIDCLFVAFCSLLHRVLFSLQLPKHPLLTKKMSSLCFQISVCLFSWTEWSVLLASRGCALSLGWDNSICETAFFTGAKPYLMYIFLLLLLFCSYSQSRGIWWKKHSIWNLTKAAKILAPATTCWGRPSRWMAQLHSLPVCAYCPATCSPIPLPLASAEGLGLPVRH